MTGAGAMLVALNFAIMAISAFSVGLVCIKLWGVLSPSGVSVSAEAGLLSQSADSFLKSAMPEKESDLFPLNHPPFRMDLKSSKGVETKIRHPRKVSRRRPRYRTAAAVPSHAINISISSSADPARNVVSMVERQPSSYEPVSMGRKSLPHESQLHGSQPHGSQPHEPQLHGSQPHESQLFQSQRHDIDQQNLPLGNAGQPASPFTSNSALQTLGFERVIEKRTLNSATDFAPQKKNGSIGQQLVEMNRKVRLGG